MRVLIGLMAALVLASAPSFAQPRIENQGASALDQTASRPISPFFNGAVDPNEGLRGIQVTPPPPPPRPNYSGEWVYYLVYAGSIFMESGAVIVRYPANKTCISGECDPQAGASLPDVCDIDRIFLGHGWLRSSCPLRVLNTVGLPSYP